MLEEKIFLTQDDAYLFGNGTHYEIYNKMGAHIATKEGMKGVYFSVWAPHASTVYVVGDFNNWSANIDYEMKRFGEGGLYELFSPYVKEGDLYKYLIVTSKGEWMYKADPYGNETELRPNTASIVTDLTGFEWTDSTWINKKKKEDHLESKMAIYEVHLGSWKKKNDGTEDGYLNYKELAKELCDYVKDTGCTHIEIMGVAEYPFDGSWGYQVTGYYSPTKRYGSPKDFMYFVNYMHKHGIGVIMDWVPAHFPKDACGLYRFDGEPVYEYADPRKGEHPDWGTCVFDYGKAEVSNFLIANALFWVEMYHIDGLRVDAVASMLYLDYGRRDGQWVPNKYGDNGNLEAMDFFKHLNSVVQSRNPQAFTIAEESTAWPNVSGKLDDPYREGCLGFTFKWNMGWMHDFLEYMQIDPYFRGTNAHKMTFSTMYAYSENFILVLSHDEVVHLKKSMLEKMPGDMPAKFANLKLGYTYMIGHPGKKLLFMGQEFGQNQEWSEKRQLDWYLLEENDHKDLQLFVKKLLDMYNDNPALYETDYNPDGFRWINANDSRCIFSFERFAKKGKDELLFVLNFAPVLRENYMVGTFNEGTYTQILSDSETEELRKLKTIEGECDGKEQYLKFDLRPYEIAVFKREKK